MRTLYVKKTKDIFHKHNVQLSAEMMNMIDEHISRSLTNMAKKFNSTLDEVLKSIPNPVALNLPKLKKVKGDKSKSQTTIKLPKLKKVT